MCSLESLCRKNQDFISMNTTRILNVDILSLTQKDLLSSLQKGVLITPNVDHLVKLQRDKEFYEVYQQAEWVGMRQQDTLSVV